MAIDFTQYLLPDGRKNSLYVERPAEIEQMAKEIEEAIAGNFACEILMSGHVSLTYETADDDMDIEVCANGPDVPLAVDRLITRIHKNLSRITKEKPE